MCGIAGVVGGPDESRSRSVVHAMLGAIEHRGPDDEGVESRAGATFGVRRLSIVDLAGGHQPVANEDGSVIAVQNGEIYNFEYLRADLRARGHRFHTRADTEVLPHAYEEWGTSFVERLRGMFALAVWDQPRQLLVLARDRFGKKPLFYARLGPGLVFGSELQAVLVHPSVTRTIDDGAIGEYLRLGYIRAPRSGFSSIRKMQPGEILELEGGATRTRVYWRLQFAPKRRMPFDDAAAELRRLLEDAVHVRLMGDVPVGAFLSGGLDSSTIVALMARHTEQPVKTFSIGFSEQQFDERRYARIVAKAFGTEHHELVVEARETDALPMLVRHLGEPFADSSIVPTYQVSRLTRPHVKVVLNGDGGDEMLAGYDRYRAAALSARLDRLPRAVRVLVARTAAALPMPAAYPVIGRVRRFALALGQSPGQRHRRWTGYFTGVEREEILGDRLRQLESEIDEIDLLDEAATLHGASGLAEMFMGSDVATYLPNDLLVKMDIGTMAASLEARSPFLDHHVAEFLASLPLEFKLGRTSKLLLRRAMRGTLPAEILTRGKMGFTAPVGAWLRGPLRAMFLDLVPDGHAVRLGYLSPGGVTRLVADHLSGERDRTPLLWSLLMLELWFREVVAGDTTARTETAALAD